MINNIEGFKFVSFTDHDSVKAYFDMNIDFLKRDDIKIIPGVEFSFSYNGVSKDILAYGIDIYETQKFLDNIYNKEFRIKKQKDILNKFKQKARQYGVIFDENLKITTGSKSEAYGLMLKSIRETPSNLKNFPEFIKGFYRTNFSNPNSSWYIDETIGLPTLEQIIQKIHDFGGKAFLAHPYDYTSSRDELDQMILDAIEFGIDGIEVDHFSNKENDRETLQKIVDEHHLFQSGGSDFHGDSVKKGIKLFVGMDNVNVKYADITKWIDSVDTLYKTFKNNI